jgi:hypothetical protein
VANYLVTRVTNSTSPALNTSSGVVVGSAGVNRFPINVASPGRRRGCVSFQNLGTGTVYITPQSANIQSSSWFTSSTSQPCIPLVGGVNPPAWLDMSNSDDVFFALSATGAGDDLRIVEGY